MVTGEYVKFVDAHWILALTFVLRVCVSVCVRVRVCVAYILYVRDLTFLNIAAFHLLG